MDSLSKENNGYKYILIVIDVLSIYAWVKPLKTKSGENLVKAFERKLKKLQKLEKLHSDKGTEFTNKLFQSFLRKKKISFFTTYNETKASVVKRFNRTLKGKIWKYFKANNTLKYVDVLQKLVRSYNNSRHRSIGIRPSDVNHANKSIVWERLYGNEASKLVKYKFSVFDEDRISKARRNFKKVTCPVGPKRYSRLQSGYVENPRYIKLRTTTEIN